MLGIKVNVFLKCTVIPKTTEQHDDSIVQNHILQCSCFLYDFITLSHYCGGIVEDFS